MKKLLIFSSFIFLIDSKESIAVEVVPILSKDNIDSRIRAGNTLLKNDTVNNFPAGDIYVTAYLKSGGICGRKITLKEGILFLIIPTQDPKIKMICHLEIDTIHPDSPRAKQFKK